MHSTEQRTPRTDNYNSAPFHPGKQTIVLKWRNAMTIAIAENFGYEQIEVRSFVKRDGAGWRKQFYFRDEEDFDDFIEALGDAADKIENQKMLTNPLPELVEGQEAPPAPILPENGYLNELKIVHKWRNVMSVVIADNRGYEQIEVKIFSKKLTTWIKVFYFRNMDDFSDFINALTDAADKIEDEKMLTNTQPLSERPFARR